MKVLYAYFVAVGVVVGCRNETTKCHENGVKHISDAVTEFRSSIGRLADMKGRQWFENAGAALLPRLRAVTNDSEKISLIHEWERAVLSASVEMTSRQERIETFRAIQDVLGAGVLNALWELPHHDSLIWMVQLDFVEWMKCKIEDMRPVEYDPNSKANRELWSGYEGAVLWYETIVEGYELDFDNAGRWGSVTDLDVVRNRFESLIGRKLRVKSEMVRRGGMFRVAQERILSEKESCKIGEE